MSLPIYYGNVQIELQKCSHALYKDKLVKNGHFVCKYNDKKTINEKINYRNTVRLFLCTFSNEMHSNCDKNVTK